MTLQEALDITDEMRPNGMRRDTKIKHLTDLEQMIHAEVIMKHEHTPEQETVPVYNEETLPGTVLLIPDPYSKVYWHWLRTRIDEQNLEDARFNADMTLFDAAWREMTSWYNRTYMPIMQNRELRI